MINLTELEQSLSCPDTISVVELDIYVHFPLDYLHS